MNPDPRLRLRTFSLAVTAMVAAGLACGPGGAATLAPEQPADTGGDSGAGSVSDLEGVETATVQIEAQGTFVDPEFGLIPNAAGRGSGFLIDPSGLAVTNNHVVTGAALLKVWVGGESEPRNARVLGVSECADLAVIDIDGDGFPYLRWLQDPVSVGMDIYVAGFPLGDPQFTITRGVISKDEAGGETSWASVESTLEYDATTNPGNSGGPVVTPDGQVVGVHFAGNSSTRQAFGIASSYARGVVEELQFGRDVESIGVNGQAVMSEDGSISGIWVASVKSGSPADRAGMQPGDILTSMEGLFLATDGTMADYCDILRSHTASDTLSIEVLRYATGEVLAGQLNGRELEVAVSPVGPAVGAAPGELLYQDDFSNAGSGWDRVSASDRTTDYANGGYRILVNDTGSDAWANPGRSFTDVRVEVDATKQGGDDNNNFGVICRSEGVQDFYTLWISSDGYYAIAMIQSGELSFLLDWTTSSAINQGNATNHIRGDCVGSTLTVFANGTELGSASDTTFTSGDVGLEAGTFDVGGTDILFDNFVVYAP